jgi:hypothetical protein
LRFAPFAPFAPNRLCALRPLRLGAASKASGLDRILKVNTVKRRTHSLYRQGLYWYNSIPDLRTDWLRRLMTAYDDIVQSHPFFSMFFALPGLIDA